MAIPGSGNPLVMGKIYQELDGAGYSASADPNEIVTLSGLVGGQPDTINSNSTSKPDTSTPHSMSEWYSYDHSAAAAFSWPTPVGGFSYANSSDYVIAAVSDTGASRNAGTQIELTFNSNGSHVHKTKDYRTGLAGTYNLGGSFSSSGTPTIIEARWVIVDGDFTMNGGTADKIAVGYVPGGSIGSVYQDVRTGSNGNATDLDFTDSWRTITPAVFGGSGSNTQTFSIQATAQSTTSNGDQAKVATSASGDYVGLQLRANSDNSKIITLRSGLSTNVSIDAVSYEPPDFSCLLPTMNVIEETRGMVPVSSIVVGERIRARGNLNDSSVEKQWATVTENSVHTRSGYWNVENGLKITNDHPVWLTDETSSAWVKVEDMRPAISRTYHEGSVDTHYIATDVGHFYAYYENVSYETPGKKWIVSGNYSPESD